MNTTAKTDINQPRRGFTEVAPRSNASETCAVGNRRPPLANADTVSQLGGEPPVKWRARIFRRTPSKTLQIRVPLLCGSQKEHVSMLQMRSRWQPARSMDSDNSPPAPRGSRRHLRSLRHRSAAHPTMVKLSTEAPYVTI